MSEKSRVARLLEMFGGFAIDEGDSENTGRIARLVVSKNRLNGPSRYGSYYKTYLNKTVKVRFSDHPPLYRDIEKEDKGVNTFIIILTTEKYSTSEIVAHINKLLQDARNNNKTDLPKEYPFEIVGANPDETKINKAKRTIGDYIGVSPSATLDALNKKLYEAVLKPDKLKQFGGQSVVPELGFIAPDGTFIDVKKHGFNSHIDFAEKVMESMNESGYGNMLKFAEQGYIRFRKDMGEAIIQASSYPTSQQLSSIRKSVDGIGKGLFEVFKNKVPEGYIEMTRDTLDADMRKLEALLNKVKSP